MAQMYSDRIKDILKTISMKNLLKDMFFNKNMIKIIENHCKNWTFFVTNLGHNFWSEQSVNFYHSVLKWDDKSIIQ